MEYKFQYENIIIFEWLNRNWEITIKENMNDDEIQSLISRRVEELNDDLEKFGDLDHSDLFVNYFEPEKNENVDYGNYN